MKYTISIGKAKEAAVEIHLDTKNPRQPNPSMMPPSVILGVGDKKKRYDAYLDKCLSDNPKLLNYLAFIHKTGNEKGSITLVARHKLGKVHAEGVRDFLTRHHETLDMILPYIFPGEGYKAPESPAPEFGPGGLPPEITSQMDGQQMMPMSGGNVQLPPEDMAQIQRLIAEDQAREAELAATKSA